MFIFSFCWPFIFLHIKPRYRRTQCYRMPNDSWMLFACVILPFSIRLMGKLHKLYHNQNTIIFLNHFSSVFYSSCVFVFTFLFIYTFFWNEIRNERKLISHFVFCEVKDKKKWSRRHKLLILIETCHFVQFWYNDIHTNFNFINVSIRLFYHSVDRPTKLSMQIADHYYWLELVRLVDGKMSWLQKCLPLEFSNNHNAQYERQQTQNTMQTHFFFYFFFFHFVICISFMLSYYVSIVFIFIKFFTFFSFEPGIIHIELPILYFVPESNGCTFLLNCRKGKRKKQIAREGKGFVFGFFVIFFILFFIRDTLVGFVFWIEYLSGLNSVCWKFHNPQCTQHTIPKCAKKDRKNK